MARLNNQCFGMRRDLAEDNTDQLMQILTDKHGHFSSYEKAHLEEDKGGIDYWVIYPGQTDRVPIQFKTRERAGFKDCPVCIYQPLYGLDHDKNMVGRDYRTLSESKSKQYYVGLPGYDGGFGSVYRISSEKLFERVKNLEQEWDEAESDERPLRQRGSYNKSYFTNANVEHWLTASIRNKVVFEGKTGQIWWKMNERSSGERRPKLNMYIAEHLREETFLINY